MTNLISKRRAPILDGRLSAAKKLAGDPLVFADIGADHGRLSAVMLLENASRRALVADISAPALSKARELIGRMGLGNRTTFAVADGLLALDEADGCVPEVVFILGMGGVTLSAILHHGHDRLQGAALVLGAQTELPLVRQTLTDIGYVICDEVIIREGQRDYILMRAEPAKNGRCNYTRKELCLGPILLKKMPAEWASVLQRRHKLLIQGIEAMKTAGLAKDADRLAEFEEEIVWVSETLQQLKQKG